MTVKASAPPILETERLRLTPLTEADAAGIFPLMRDAEVWRSGTCPRATIRT